MDKVVLAYSGGLDTSIIVKWLQDTYQCEVITFTADIGQGEEVEPDVLKQKRPVLNKFLLKIYVKNLRVILCFQCSVQMRFMKVSIY